MKILHVCLASAYTEGMAYQDNLLPNQNALDGHEVTVVSDCHKYHNGQLVSVPEEDRRLANGIRLVRLKYAHIVNRLISSKVKKVHGLYDLIESIQPDVILFHGVVGWELLTVGRYKGNYPNVRLYLDSHEDFNNSAKNNLSKYLQYLLFNRVLVRLMVHAVDKILYVSDESRTFLKKMYGISDSMMEFYPLGGDIIDSETKKRFSAEIRTRHQFSSDDILIVHAGKLSSEKRTIELVRSFLSVDAPNFKLLIIGYIPDSVATDLVPLIERDRRVEFLGWKDATELIKYLCAANLYFQPGSQSATMQTALCCGAPVALFPHISHQPYLHNNGFFIRTDEDMKNLFSQLSKDATILSSMSEASYAIAKRLLDYKVLASRLYR